jgi:hypothetical protein
MAELKFKFNQLEDLDRDFQSSTKVLPIIIAKVLTLKLRELRGELRSFIPRTTGNLAKSFGFSVRRRRGLVTGRIGFFSNKRTSASTAIAANVLQKGGATPKKGAYLWIPLGMNRNADGSAQLTPRQLIDSGGFVTISKAGNKIAFQRSGDQIIPAFILKTAVKLSRPPVPIEQRVEAALPEITSDIPEFIKQVIEAKRAVQNVELD